MNSYNLNIKRPVSKQEIISTEITGAYKGLTNADLHWIKRVSTYLLNGDMFILPSNFQQWILSYNGAGVKVIKPSGKGNHKETIIKFW